MPDEDIQPTVDTSGANAPPVVPPPPPQPDMTAPDIGGGQPGAPPPMQAAPTPMPPRPPGTSSLGQYQGSRSQIFRSILGDFLYSAGKGLAASGHGPEANARSVGAAMEAIPDRDILHKQLAMEAQKTQAEADYKHSVAAQYQQEPVTLSNGETVMMNSIAAAKVRQAQEQAKGRENVQGIKNVGAAAVQGLKNDATSDTNQTKKDIETSKEKSNADLLGSKIKSSEKIAQWKISGAKDVAQLKMVAGQAAREAKQDEPTAQAKNSAETARVVQSGITRIRPMIDQLDKAGALGAVKGKVNDLIEGKQGFDGLGLSPENSRLMENFIDSLKFVNSGMLKTHFGARGGQQLYGKFTQMLNAGQGVDVMKGGLDAFDFYAGRYAEEGKRPGAANNTPKGGLTADDLLKKYPPKKP